MLHPDLILCVPYLATSSTKGWMYFLNSSLVKVEGALDPSCKSRRSGTKLRSNGSSKAAASLQIPEVRTSEKQKHKVNEMKSASSYRRATSVSEEDIPKTMVGCAALMNLPTPNKFANWKTRLNYWPGATTGQTNASSGLKLAKSGLNTCHIRLKTHAKSGGVELFLLDHGSCCGGTLPSPSSR